MESQRERLVAQEKALQVEKEAAETLQAKVDEGLDKAEQKALGAYDKEERRKAWKELWAGLGSSIRGD